MPDGPLKHKPQKKHTLEEVLKSLQDLIRNDLIEAERVAQPPPASAAQSPPPPADAFDDALDTLDHLIDHELIEPAKQARANPPPTDDDLPPDDTSWPDDDTLINESLAADEALSAATSAGKDIAPQSLAAPGSDAPRGVQDAFPFDVAPADASAPEEIEAAPAPDAAEPIADATIADVPPRTNSARPLPEDDIPVLHEVAHEILAAAPTLPTPEQARDIAIHVVARLNIELRKGGAQPLDPSTIDRLQKLLGEALASKASGNS